MRSGSGGGWKRVRGWMGAGLATLGASAGGQELATDRPNGRIELVATFTGAMPTGVTVSKAGRIFVCMPRWGDDVKATVAEVRGGQLVPYPDELTNRGGMADPPHRLISVQSVVVDPRDRLWLVDTGSVEFGPIKPGGAKLVEVDLATDQVVKRIPFDPDVALPMSYLNDVRFDLTRGPEGTAYLTDSSAKGENALIVVDLATGKSLRRLARHPSTLPEPGFLPIVEGRPLLNRMPGEAVAHLSLGADGIAIGHDGKKLYYCPLASRKLYEVSTELLADPAKTDAEVAQSVADLGEKGASDGLESDASGRIYATSYETNSILRRETNGAWRTLVHDPRLLWPDTMSVAADGYLYFTANQLHRQKRYHDGQEMRVKPYSLWRVKIDAGPVLLR